MSYLKASDWERFSKIVNEFVDTDAGLQPFRWLKSINIPLMFGEDQGERFQPIDLLGLFHYNYIRVWPYNIESPSGTLDATSLVLYITIKQLKELGYLDEFGYWKFNNVSDRFILNGKVYKPSGDTQVAQAGDRPLMFYVILDIVTLEETNKILKTYKI